MAPTTLAKDDSKNYWLTLNIIVGTTNKISTGTHE